MNSEQAHDLLRMSMSTLADVPDELIESLFGICRLVHIEAGQILLMAGDVPDDMGLNLNGIYRLYYIDDDGNDLTKGFCTPGRFVVSYSAMVQQRPSYFFIEALVEADVLLFKFSHWMQMAHEDLRWYPVMLKLVESVYIMKEMREKAFLLDDATTRYLDFRRDYPGLENQIKLYHVASFLGITPEALSRIRRRLKLT